MIKKLSIILIFAIIFTVLSSCKNDEKKSDGNLNSEFIQRVYKSKSLLFSRNESNRGDYFHGILKSEHDGNYYVSLYSAANHKEQINIYNEKFEYVKVIENDIADIDSSTTRHNIFTIDKNNNIYLVQYVITDPVKHEISPKDRVLLVFNNNGEAKDKIAIEDVKDIPDGNGVHKIFVTDDNYIFVSSAGIQITDKTGKTTKEIINNGNFNTFMINTADIGDNNSLYYSCGDGYLIKYDLKQNKELWLTKLDRYNFVNNISYSSLDNQICIQTNNLLLLYDTEGNYLGDICDLRDIAPSDENIYIENYSTGGFYNLLYLDNKNIIFTNLLFTNGSEGNIDEIVKLQALSDEEAEIVIKKREEEQKGKAQVKIFLPHYDPKLDVIINDFNKTYPTINVITEFYVNDSSLFNYSDYIQHVTTRINAGEDDWDIMSGDYIQYKTYIAKNYFMDLDSLDSENILKDDSRYFTNILDACREKDGKLYYLPNVLFVNIIESLKSTETIKFKSIKDLLENSLSLKSQNKYPFNNKDNINSIIVNLFQEFCCTEYGNIYFNKEKFYEALDIIKQFYDDSLYSNDINNAEYDLNYLGTFYTDFNTKTINIMPSGMNDSEGEKNIFTSNGYLITAKSKTAKEAFKFLEYLSDYNYYNSIGISKKLVPENSNIYEIYESLNYTATYHIDFIVLFYDQIPKYIDGSITKEEFAGKIEDFIWLIENEDK